MADSPHMYHIAVGGGGCVVTDLQSVFGGDGRGRRVKIFAYGFLFAFVAATAFLAFNPSVATSSPGSIASSPLLPLLLLLRVFWSQISNLISSIFPASHPSVTANATRPNGAAEKGVVSGSRATNLTASLAKKNATIGASEAARNGTKQERAPAESSDQKALASSKNQTFVQNLKNQTKSLDKEPSSVAGDHRIKIKTVDLKPKNGTFASNPTAKKVADQPARQYSLKSMKKCDLFLWEMGERRFLPSL